jgi:uncharacterized protein DUF6683
MLAPVGMRTLLVALVLAATARIAAADDWINPYNGTHWNNPMSQLADVMLTQTINNAALNASLRTKQAGAAPTNSAPVTHAAIAKTDFTPGKKRLVVDQIIGGLTQNDQQRQALVGGMEQVFAAYEKAVRKDNVAYSVAFLLAASLTVQTGQQVDDAQSQQLALAINDALANNPAFAKSSAADRQKIYESCITLGGLVLLFNEAGKQDQASANAAKLLAKQSLAMLGVK